MVLSKEEKIKFKSSLNDAGRSLYGSLKSRLLVSLQKIIQKFPAALYADSNSIAGITPNTAQDISYDVASNMTTFFIEFSKLYNIKELAESTKVQQLQIYVDQLLKNVYASKRNQIKATGDFNSVVGLQAIVDEINALEDKFLLDKAKSLAKKLLSQYGTKFLKLMDFLIIFLHVFHELQK
mgnify:CR=1 FL=1